MSDAYLIAAIVTACLMLVIGLWPSTEWLDR